MSYQDEILADHEKRIEALEARLDVEEKAMRKQRAVNEALWEWIATSADNQKVPINEHENLRNVLNALRNALK